MRASLGSLFLAFVLAAPAARANVLVVGGGGPHNTIQSAIDAASDGDVVLVRPGTYAGFTVQNKGVAVVADVGGPVSLTGALIVRDVAVTSACVFSGLLVTPPSSPTSSGGSNALQATNCAGSLRFVSCVLRGAANQCLGYGPIISQCLNLAFVDCEIGGADGVDANAGQSMYIDSSRIAFERTTLRAGRGGPCQLNCWGYDQAGYGGDGTHIATNSIVMHYGGSVSGGDGGNYACVSPPTGRGGYGGRGMLLGSINVVARRLNCPIRGGAGGQGTPPGSPGAAFLLGTGSSFGTYNGRERLITGPRVAREGDLVTLDVHGQPGDFAYLRSRDRKSVV